MHTYRRYLGIIFSTSQTEKIHIHKYMHAYKHTYSTCIHTYIHTYRSIVLYLFTYVHPYIHTGTFELLFRTTTTSASSSLLSVRGKIDGESCCKDVKAAASDWSLIHIDYIFIHTLIHTYIHIHQKRTRTWTTSASHHHHG